MAAMPTKQTTRRKNLKPAAAPKEAPKRNNVNFILSDKEKARIDGELVKLGAATGMHVKMGALAKHALLNNSRHRSIEAKLRDLIGDLRQEPYTPAEFEISEDIERILSEVSPS
jgi:hypothetical protein